ncbi:MAG: WHG domain-containing protein [Anderseniella sp.]|uniref:TetR/AcrR family transcriptional regulator n=1 Tax=Parasphingorhabdus sp. TaxID=2709688 RepID=UPI003288D9D9
MAGKREIVRRELTRNLLDAAAKRISMHGLDALRARDVTNDAGCGLGTIYKCFADLDDLIIHVNSVTLSRLKLALTEASRDRTDPVDVLKALAFTYVEFAQRHSQLWRALFEHRLPEGQQVPEWYQLENTALLGFITQPVSALEPGLTDQQLASRSRTLFAAIHGVVSISLEGRFVGLEDSVLKDEIDELVERMAVPRAG